MASSKLHLLHMLPFGKALSLPALSLALLTGFTFSIILPSSLHPLFPAMESLFLVSLPHLWQASVSWFTPPCLFLLLNSIIVILTATSGSLSSGPSSTNSLAKLEKFTSDDAAIASTEPPASTATSTPPIEPDTPVDVAAPAGIDRSMSLPALHITTRPMVSFSKVPICYHCLQHTAQDAPAAAMEKPELQLKDQKSDEDFHDVDGSLHDDDDDNTIVDIQIVVSQDGLQRTVAIIDSAETNGRDDPAASSSSCEELLQRAGSEPSTPKYSSALPMKDSMRRTLSVDSAPYIDDIEESPEYKLSEEAFKKRIEDYIFKVNAKLRSETRLLS